MSCSTILLLLLGAGALWSGVGQHGFVSRETILQEVGSFRTDDCRFLSWGGLRQVTQVLVMLAKWISLPRLETRTKESNICASIGVANPHAQ